MAEFVAFWDAMQALHLEGQQLYQQICDFCQSVTRMREPHINETVDDLQRELNTAMEEDFVFTEVHNERDNLFTYQLGQCDHKFVGLLGYVPYLLKIATNICFWCNKMYLEKE